MRPPAAPSFTSMRVGIVRTRSHRASRWLATAIAIHAVLAALAPRTMAAQSPITYIEVALDDETRRADEKLRRYLTREVGLEFVSERPLEYGAVIDRLVNWNKDKGHYLARTTPYVFVAAEILGADLHVVATYMSRATERTTYHSYFVVNRESFPYTPELANVVEYLKHRQTPARFIYHSKFSTSSYFLPSLYFRANAIFNMRESTQDNVAIHTEQMGDNASDLVKAVASGEYELAAVYDGTKTKFQTTDSLSERYGSKVYFVRLPTPLPNDLLVSSTALDSSTQAKIHNAVEAMRPTEIDEGDFLTWRDFLTAQEARRALADLRWLARERPAPVTVEVRSVPNGERLVPEAYLAAARQAVRLSGTEFVTYDDDFHQQQDYVWTIELIHDGAVLLKSRIVGSDITDQEFQISFKDVEDLTRRIGALLDSRIHRVRYVWPYRSERPTVIRDVGFSLPEDAIVKVRKIRWLDPQRNLFLHDAEFEATVARADFYKFELAPNFIDSEVAEYGFNPMSNISYRVILARPAQERALFRVLTVVFVLALVAAALAAVAGLFQSQPRPLEPL